MRKIFLNFLFLSLLQPIYSMENNEFMLRKLFCYAVELAQNNGFKKENCARLIEILKEHKEKGANFNWEIGDNKETVLHLAVKNQQKELFKFLLENKADINACNKNSQTPLHYLVQTCGNHTKEIDIEDLIKHKADINAKTIFEELHSYSHYIQFLIQHGADINSVISTSLAIVIDPLGDTTSVIKKLCNYGASLINVTNNNNNIFHRIIKVANDTSHTPTDSGLISVRYIKTIITHARFDNFDKDSKKTLFALWFFKQLALEKKIILPNDIKLHILAQLPPSDLYPYKKLCEVLIKGNYNHILLPLIHERVENIKQILASPDENNQTALEFMLKKFANNKNYINNVKQYLDGTLLQKNYDDFIKYFPTIVNSELEENKNNLARQMFDNCAELFLQ